MENKQEFSVQYLQKSDLDSVSICGALASQVMFAQAMRVLRQNLRQGTVACKGRSDVARSNKKPWKQKGTGRARAGSARSPLWKGGGVIHGPQARVAELKINKHMKQQVFSSLCSQMLDNKRVLCVDLPISEGLKTRHLAMFLKQLGISMSKVLFFMNFDNMALLRNISNIQSVRPIFFDQPDVATLADADYWLVLKADYDVFKSMVGKWL